MFELQTRFGKLQILDPQAAQKILSNYANGKSKSFHFVNAFVLSEANKNKEYYEILARGQCFCDSRILEIYSRVARSPIEQLRGFDFLKDSLPKPEMGSQLIIGGTQKSEEELVRLVGKYFGNKVNLSFHQPEFTSDISVLHASSLHVIKRLEPKTVWLGVGTPKQDYLASHLRSDFDGYLFCVGAAVAFLAGDVSESPKWIQRVGLEWLYRLGRDPRRLWKRYLFGNLNFLAMLTKDFASRIFSNKAFFSGE